MTREWEREREGGAIEREREREREREKKREWLRHTSVSSPTPHPHPSHFVLVGCWVGVQCVRFYKTVPQTSAAWRKTKVSPTCSTWEDGTMWPEHRDADQISFHQSGEGCQCIWKWRTSLSLWGQQTWNAKIIIQKRHVQQICDTQMNQAWNFMISCIPGLHEINVFSKCKALFNVYT